MSDIQWTEGPPPGRGHWWAVIKGEVKAVAIRTPIDDLSDNLLIYPLGELEWTFSEIKDIITHHAPMEYPEPPKGGK